MGRRRTFTPLAFDCRSSSTGSGSSKEQQEHAQDRQQQHERRLSSSSSFSSSHASHPRKRQQPPARSRPEKHRARAAIDEIVDPEASPSRKAQQRQHPPASHKNRHDESHHQQPHQQHQRPRRLPQSLLKPTQKRSKSMLSPPSSLSTEKVNAHASRTQLSARGEASNFIATDGASDRGGSGWTRDAVMNHLPTQLSSSLMPFQVDGVAFAMRNNGRVLIGDEMGLGKTVQAIATAYLCRDKWPLLVIVPASVKGPWVDELEKWLPMVSPSDYNIVRSGKDIANMHASITVVTYGMLKQPLLLKAIAAVNFKVVIVDESHYLKNRKTKRTMSIQPILKQATHCLLLSGTPALSRPEELYVQLDSLRPGKFGSFTSFAQRYCNAHNDRFGWNTKGASHLDELNRRLNDGVMIRRLKDDVLTQLPPKRRQRISIKVDDPKHVKLLEAGFRALKATDEDADAGKFESYRLLQELYMDTCRAKIAKTQEYIKGLCEAGGKFLVFAYHLEMLDALEACVAATGTKYVVIVGETPTQERYMNVKEFQSNKSCKVAILSLLAASQGITLTAASTVVFAELHWTPGIMEQAEDRVHRIGQGASSVNVHFLVTENSMDDILWSTLVRKVGVVSATLNGKSRRLKAAKTSSTTSIDEFKENNLLSPTDEDSDCDESSEKDQIPDGDKAEDDTQGLLQAWSDSSPYLLACHGEAPITSKQDIRLFFGKKSGKKAQTQQQQQQQRSLELPVPTTTAAAASTKRRASSLGTPNMLGAHGSRSLSWICPICTFHNTVPHAEKPRKRRGRSKGGTTATVDASHKKERQRCKMCSALGEVVIAGSCSGDIDDDGDKGVDDGRRQATPATSQESIDIADSATDDDNDDNDDDDDNVDDDDDDDVVLTKVEKEDGWSLANIPRVAVPVKPTAATMPLKAGMASAPTRASATAPSKLWRSGANGAGLCQGKKALQLSLFKFCVSSHTGRVFLYNREGKPLCINFRMEDFVHNNTEALPPKVLTQPAFPETAHFIKEYRQLRPFQQAQLTNRVMASVQEGLESATSTTPPADEGRKDGRASSTTNSGTTESAAAPASQRKKKNVRSSKSTTRFTPASHFSRAGDDGNASEGAHLGERGEGRDSRAKAATQGLISGGRGRVMKNMAAFYANLKTSGASRQQETQHTAEKKPVSKWDKYRPDPDDGAIVVVAAQELGQQTASRKPTGSNLPHRSVKIPDMGSDARLCAPATAEVGHIREKRNDSDDDGRRASGFGIDGLFNDDDDDDDDDNDDSTTVESEGRVHGNPVLGDGFAALGEPRSLPRSRAFLGEEEDSVAAVVAKEESVLGEIKITTFELPPAQNAAPARLGKADESSSQCGQDSEDDDFEAPQTKRAKMKDAYVSLRQESSSKKKSKKKPSASKRAVSAVVKKKNIGKKKSTKEMNTEGGGKHDHGDDGGNTASGDKCGNAESGERCKYCRKVMDALPALKQTFCSHECWENFSVRTGNVGLIRGRLFAMEGGVCQLCGVNAHDLYTRVKALAQPELRRKVLCASRFQFLTASRITSISAKPVEGDFWQADHINPVCEGGGECDLENYRTLCTPCHSKETKQLTKGKARRKLERAAQLSKDIRGFFKA